MKRRVVIFSDWFAPGYRAGGPIQSLVNLTKALVEIDFFVITSDTDHHATAPYTEVEANCWNAFQPHIQVMYCSADQINATTFSRLISEIDPDTIYLNSLFSAQFTLLPLRVLRTLPNKRSVVVAPRGMLKSAALKEKALKKTVFLWLANRLGWYRDVLWHATNAEELEEVRAHFGSKARGCIADNLTGAPIPEWAPKSKAAGQCRMLCLARISPEKGIEEALQFLEGQDWRDQLAIDFIGAQQNETFLAKCRAIEQRLIGVQCRFLGELPPPVIEQKWSEYHFLYLPTRGENFGHAIAESINNGVPVLISDRTPWRNLSEMKLGWDLSLEKEPFVDAVKIAIAMHQEEYNDLSKQTWAWAQSNFSGSVKLNQSRNLFGLS